MEPTVKQGAERLNNQSWMGFSTVDRLGSFNQFECMLSVLPQIAARELFLLSTVLTGVPQNAIGEDSLFKGCFSSSVLRSENRYRK